MAKRLSGVFGFVTNSSSAIMHFPREILDHPEVKHFMDTYGIHSGYVGENLWHRSHCETLAIGPDAKKQVLGRLETDLSWSEDEYFGPSVDTENDGVLLIYGDEYPGLTMSLAGIMRRAATELSLSYDNDDYN